MSTLKNLMSSVRSWMTEQSRVTSSEMILNNQQRIIFYTYAAKNYEICCSVMLYLISKVFTLLEHAQMDDWNLLNLELGEG